MKRKNGYPAGKNSAGKRFLALFVLMTLLLVMALSGCGKKVEASFVKSTDDLGTAKIGVQLGTTGDIYASDYEKEGATIVKYGKGTDAIQALKQGKVDAVIIDNEPAKNFVETNEGLKILDTEYVTEDYAACINKDNTKLLDAVNGAIAELKEDGSLQKIIDQYITAE